LSANLHLVGGVYQATTQTIAHPNHTDPRIIAGVFHGPTDDCAPLRRITQMEGAAF
jgi:hypothetical protein